MPPTPAARRERASRRARPSRRRALFALPYGTWDITVSGVVRRTVTLATTQTPPGPRTWWWRCDSLADPSRGIRHDAPRGDGGRGVLGIVMLVRPAVGGHVRTAATGGIRRLENLDEARSLMQVLTKDVRTTDETGHHQSPFILADDNEVTFYANLNLTTACPKRVHLYIDSSDRLVENVTQPDAGRPPRRPARTPAPSRPGSWAGTWTTPADQPIFTYYYDNAGVLTAFPTTSTPLSPRTVCCW